MGLVNYYRLWQQQPLLLPAVSWLVGQACAGQLSPWLLLVGAVGGLMGMWRLHQAWLWLATGCLWVCMGGLLGSLQLTALPVQLPAATARYRLALTSDIQPTNKGFSVWAEADSVAGKEVPSCGLLVYLSDSLGRQLRAGCQLQVYGKAAGLPAQWPAGYRLHLQRQGITHQLFVHDILTQQPDPSFTGRLLRLRDYLLAQIALQVGPDAAGGATAALLLGNKAYLPQDLRAAYRDTGTLHVLAISGMHLSVIVAAISFLLLRVDARGRYHWPPILLIAVLLAGYTLLAGAAPAIVRALCMGLLTLIAIATGNRPAVLNLLCASAMLQTALWPNALYDIGFQLSYTAVLGIVLLTPRVQTYTSAWHIGWRWPAQLLAATGAATIFTAPVLLYHFGQLPPLFLVSNLLAIPLASLATLTGFAFLLLHALPGVGALLGSTTAVLMQGLNAWVAATASWVPTWQGLYITSTGALLSLAVLMLLGLVLQHRRSQQPDQSLPF